MLLAGPAELGGSLCQKIKRLLRSQFIVHVLSERGQSGVLGQNLVKRLVRDPRGGLLLGGVDELGAHLRARGVEKNGVSDGGAVLIVDVAHLKLRGGLGAGRGPDGDGTDGDDVGIHRRLVVGGLGVDVVDGPSDIHLNGAIGRRGRDGGDGAELPSGGSSS